MKPIFQALLASVQGSSRASYEEAIKTGVFYIVAETTMSGQYAMGSTELTLSGEKFIAPCVHATAQEADLEWQSEVEEHHRLQVERNAEELALFLEEGGDEEDFEIEDDECPLDVYMMKWDGGDKVQILTRCGQFVEDDEHTWQFHCGV